MPELVEIILTRKKIKERIKNRKLTAIYKNGSRTMGSLIGLRPKIKSLGKLLIFDFGEKYLIIHANLKGHWTKEKTDHTKLEMHFEDVILYYEDTSFGYIKLVSELPELNDASKISIQDFMQVLNSKANIYSVLTNQKKIAGLGNYLTAEILHKANINPTKVSALLSKDEMKKLYLSMKSVIAKSLSMGGSPYYCIFGVYGKYKPKVYRASNNYKTINGRKVYV